MTTQSPRRILIVRLGSLGDLIHALLAVARARAAWPAAEIDWLVERAHADLLALVPVLAQVIVLEDRSLIGWSTVTRVMRSRGYDLAIDLQGLMKSAALARLSGARRVAGFDRAALREPGARFLYSESIVVGEGRHVIAKNLALVDALTGADAGDPAAEDGLQFPLDIPRSPALDALRTQVAGDVAVINAGAAWPNKRWPAARFGAIAQWLRTTYGWTPVVLWGPGEQALGRAVVEASGGAAVCAPATTLADVLAIARDAKVFVSGDTGPLHLAGAMGTPLVALFGPTTPDRNGPWDARDVSISRYAGCACHYKRECRQPASWCLEGISVEDVVQAIARRVGSS